MSSLHKLRQPNFLTMLMVVVISGGVGGYLLTMSYASTATPSLEAKQGQLSGFTRLNDSSASGQAAVRFDMSVPSGGQTVYVSTAEQLTAALSTAQPGDVIHLADGTYSGHFNSTASGTASAPISLTGSRNAILDGGSLGGGYTFSLGSKNTALSISYWKLTGFTVTGGQKGMVLDNVQHSLIDSIYVHQIGEEGIHLRDNSSNNIVQNSTITKTGQDVQAYGEGLYVGSAVSNWSSYSQGSPDHSNNNQLLHNDISYTGAENIDIKLPTSSRSGI